MSKLVNILKNTNTSILLFRIIQVLTILLAVVTDIVRTFVMLQKLNDEMYMIGTFFVYIFSILISITIVLMLENIIDIEKQNNLKN